MQGVWVLTEPHAGWGLQERTSQSQACEVPKALQLCSRIVMCTQASLGKLRSSRACQVDIFNFKTLLVLSAGLRVLSVHDV